MKFIKTLVVGSLVCGLVSYPLVHTQARDRAKPTLAVADFQDKTSSASSYRSEFGRGIGDMLLTALGQTGYFEIIDMNAFEAIMTVRGSRTLPKPDLLVMGAITEFDPENMQVQGRGWPSLPFGINPRTKILGGWSLKKAHVGMDLRLVDGRTARVVGKPVSVQGAAHGVGVHGPLGTDLSGFYKTPMGQAIRSLIKQAVDTVIHQYSSSKH